MNLYFSDIFEVIPKDLDKYGAFNISLVTDLSLLRKVSGQANSRPDGAAGMTGARIDSRKKEGRELHDDIIRTLQ